MTLKDQIWLALKQVPYPGYSRNIVSFLATAERARWPAR